MVNIIMQSALVLMALLADGPLARLELDPGPYQGCLVTVGQDGGEVYRVEFTIDGERRVAAMTAESQSVRLEATREGDRWQASHASKRPIGGQGGGRIGSLNVRGDLPSRGGELRFRRDEDTGDWVNEGDRQTVRCGDRFVLLRGQTGLENVRTATFTFWPAPAEMQEAQ